MRAQARVLIVAVLCATAASAYADEVTFQVDGKRVPLSEQERAAIAARASDLMSGCGMTSGSSPQIFAGRDLEKEWRETRAGAHLHVRFEKPLEARRGSLRVSQAVIGFGHANMIGPELTRHGDAVTGHVKCDGHRSLALMCATALRRHLLPGQQESCKAYDRIGEPRKAP